MYRRYWGMQVHPFAGEFSPAFHVPIEWAELARAKLAYVFNSTAAAAAITGGTGLGKSQLARVVAEDLKRAGWRTARVRAAYGGEAALAVLRPLLDGTGGEGRETEAGGDSPGFLPPPSTPRTGERFCLVLDDVHLADDPRVLELSRLLLDASGEGHGPVGVLFVGQPGMEEKLRSASGLDTHLAICIRAVPMSREETKRYMLFRLKAAGCSRGLFTRHAAELVHEFSQGIARNVNRLCELALVTGFGLGVEKIGPRIVQTAARELGLAAAPQPATSLPAPEEDILAGIG